MQLVTEPTDATAKTTPITAENNNIVIETIKPNEVTSIGIEMSVTDGQPYGCDVICWFDGFGFCYNVEKAENATYTIQLGEKVTVSEVYAEDEDISFPRDSSGYCVYLASETISYRIGFLRILDKPHIWGYGTFFELLTEEDPQAELLPEEPEVDYQWEEDAAWFEEVNEDGSISMIPTEFEETDYGFDEVEDAEGESLSVKIADEAIIMICFFDSQRPDMLVTKERMMQLIRDGYFMEYPCWVNVINGELLAAMQINSF
jgi:hypothetical protein